MFQGCIFSLSPGSFEWAAGLLEFPICQWQSQESMKLDFKMTDLQAI
jgi:hypothetical protein